MNTFLTFLLPVSAAVAWGAAASDGWSPFCVGSAVFCTLSCLLYFLLMSTRHA